MTEALTEANSASVLMAMECRELNELETVLAENRCAPPPIIHTFTPGLYARTCLLRAGMVCTSRIHLTEHQFIISKGLLDIWIPSEGWKRFKAPYHGITRVGTRRALRIVEDTIFTTFHATSSTNPEEITRMITAASELSEKPEAIQ